MENIISYKWYKVGDKIFKSKYNVDGIDTSRDNILMCDYIIDTTDNDKLYQECIITIPFKSEIELLSAERCSELYAYVKKFKGLFDVEVLEMNVNTKDDLEYVKYMMKLQDEYPDDIVINDATECNDYSLFPNIRYYAYIKVELCEKLQENDSRFKEIYEYTFEDGYDNQREMPGLERRVRNVKRTIVIE